MRRFSLAHVRLIMQQNSRTFNAPRGPGGFGGAGFGRPPSAAFSSAQSWGHAVPGAASTHSAFGEDAWTSYDGLGPVDNKPRNVNANWRSGGGRGNNSGRGNNYNGRNDSRRDIRQSHPPPGPPPASKRGRPTPGSRASRAPSDARGGRGGNSNQGLIDDNYLDQNYAPFVREDLPGPKFDKAVNNPKGFLWDTKEITARASYGAQRGGVFRCSVILRLPDNSQLDALGEHSNKKLAEKIACRHAILKLREEGKLKDLVGDGLHSAVNDKALLKDEEDAKKDIYDYCARFDTIPTIVAREVRRPASRKSIVEVVIEMPEHNIQASAKAMDRKVAEILASVEFKRKAEEYQSKYGEEDIVVKDLSELNTRNARKFFEFFKMQHPGTAYDIALKPSKGGNKRLTGNHTTAQMILNGEPLGEAIEFQGKKHAESVGYLAGAVALKKKHPELFQPFVDALIRGNGELLKPVSPSWMRVTPDATTAMADTMIQIRRIGLPPTVEEIDAQEEEVDKKKWRRGPARRSLDPAFAEVKSQKMKEEFEAYHNDPLLETLRRKREELPMNQYTEQVMDLINGNDVCIVVGATGSGKTTQVPQLVLDQAIREGHGAECNIICTQPRRIAATSVAQRVAVERNEPLQKSIGYQVRFDSKPPIAGGSVTYCTTGILLQQLRHEPEAVLDGITHLIIDEVHERDILIDYLLIILKRIMKDRKKQGKVPVKIILMSATMDTTLFGNYFRQKNPDGTYTECPDVSVPGRTFPVKDYYLEDIKQMLETTHGPRELSLLREDDTRKYMDLENAFVPVSRAPSRAVSAKEEVEEEDDGDAVINWKQETLLRSDGATAVSSEKEDAIVPVGLIATTLAHIAKTTTDGAILVFLPGLDEIQKVEEMIRRSTPLGINFNDESKFKLHLLHSSIPNQNEVFTEVPEGCRKIILSTNIAETSVTIPDVQYVIDSGKLREKQYEQERRITQLVCTWVSKSNSKQRAGRAGRVQNGNYFALFSRKRFDSLRPTGLPEMLRSDLQEICLDIKSQGFNDPVGQFLSEAIEPPAPQAIQASLRQLNALGALTDNERLTQLGHVLATMPVEPALGKMILLAVIFRCLDPIVILGASAGGRDLFVAPPDRRKEANEARQSFIQGTGSDHMGIINAFRSWRDVRERDGQYAAFRFADENFLHRGALRTLDQTCNQILEILQDTGVIPRPMRGDRRNTSIIGPSRLNENSESVPLIKALTLSGMYPNLAICTGGKGLRTAGENFVMIHPSSVHYIAHRGRSKNNEDEMPIGTLITFSAKARSNDGNTILLRTNTDTSALVAVLFGGNVNMLENSRIELDGWLPFLVRWQEGKTLSEFKKLMDRLLAHAFRNLSHRSEGSIYLADDPAREAFANGLVDVLDYDIRPRERSLSSGWGQRTDSPARRADPFRDMRSDNNRPDHYRPDYLDGRQSGRSSGRSSPMPPMWLRERERGREAAFSAEFPTLGQTIRRDGNVQDLRGERGQSPGRFSQHGSSRAPTPLSRASWR